MAASTPAKGAPEPPAPSLGELTRTFWRIGLASFGGPAGQIALMHRVLVQEKRWIRESRYLRALDYCMFLPGPEAQQLATYVGWMLHGWRGGVIAGGLFVLPGLVVILALSWLHARFHDLGPVAGLLLGLKAAIVVVVVEAVIRIGRRALRGRLHVALAAAAFAALFFFDVPFPLVVLVAGGIGALSGWLAPAAEATERAPPAPWRPRRALVTAGTWLVLWLAPVAVLVATLQPGHVLVEEAVFFSKAAVVTFGGAYAVLAYVAQAAVERFGWLGPGEMLDGLGLAETTPGPLILVLVFVAFQGAWNDPGTLPPAVAGLFGGLLTAWVTFIPSFLFIFAGAPLIERLDGWRPAQRSLEAITAAVVGVILNLAAWLALHVFFGAVAERKVGPLRLLVPEASSVSLGALVIAGLAAVALLRFRLGLGWTLAGAALLGLALHALGAS